MLLVLGRERLLLLALTPLIAGAAALPWWEPGPLLRSALPLLALLAVLAAAARALTACLTAPAATSADPRPPLRASVPYGLFGLAAAVLTLLEGRHDPFAVLALTLSMGPAEWLLYRYRGWSVTALRASSTPAAFLLRSCGVLALCLTAYLLVLLPPALFIATGPAALLCLAAVLWTALLLQAFGVAWPPALVCLAAAAAAAGTATLTASPPGRRRCSPRSARRPRSASRHSPSSTWGGPPRTPDLRPRTTATARHPPGGHRCRPADTGPSTTRTRTPAQRPARTPASRPAPPPPPSKGTP